jgi:hypothetical protein
MFRREGCGSKRIFLPIRSGRMPEQAKASQTETMSVENESKIPYPSRLKTGRQKPNWTGGFNV